MASDVVFDPYSDVYFDDPYDLYKKLRDEAPVSYNPQYNFYSLVRYADVVEASKDHETLVSGISAREPRTHRGQHERAFSLQAWSSSRFCFGSRQVSFSFATNTHPADAPNWNPETTANAFTEIWPTINSSHSSRAFLP
jgi:hypothetical protein